MRWVSAPSLSVTVGYERECTPEEAAILEASATAAEAERRAEQEAERDAWFAMLVEQDEARPDEPHQVVDA